MDVLFLFLNYRKASTTSYSVQMGLLYLPDEEDEDVDLENRYCL